jgi:hemerythrin superfamily protein
MAEHRPDDDVIAELVTDHREVEEMFARLETELLPDERQDLLEQVTAELVRHAVAEEAWLYPAVRDRVPGGDAIADKEREDHQQVEELLKQLEGEDPHDPTNRATLHSLMATVREHVEDEEANLFPALRDVYTQQELQDLGDKVRTAKRAAPTRPHPMAPRDATSRRVLGPFVGLVDRTRDTLTGRSS